MLNTGYSCSSNYHPCQKVNKNTRFHAIVVKTILSIVGKNGIANNNYIFLRIFYTFINLFILFTPNQLPWKHKGVATKEGNWPPIYQIFVRFWTIIEKVLTNICRYGKQGSICFSLATMTWFNCSCLPSSTLKYHLIVYMI